MSDDSLLQEDTNPEEVELPEYKKLDTIPSALRRAIYEMSGGADYNKGFYLFVCNADGFIETYSFCEGAIEDAIIQNMVYTIAQHNAKRQQTLLTRSLGDLGNA